MSSKKFDPDLPKPGTTSFPRENDIWLVKFDKLKEFSKPYRPCLVVSNNTQNEFDENIVVVGLTTDEMEKIRTFEVYIKNTKETGLEEESKICCDYLHTVKRTFNKVLTEFEKTLYKKLRLVDKKRLGTVSPETMIKVKRALKIVLNLEKEV